MIDRMAGCGQVRRPKNWTIEAVGAIARESCNVIGCVAVRATALGITYASPGLPRNKAAEREFTPGCECGDAG